MSRIIAVIVTLVVGAWSFLPICDLHFDCGCVSLWAGAADHCDIHVPGPPDCPWCHHPWMGYAAMLIATMAGLGGIVLSRKSTRWLVPMIAGLLGFHAALVLLGLLTSLMRGTPVLAGLG